jgi:4-hydroxymandelate oxidase
VKPPLSAIPPQIASLADYEAYARERVADDAWAYLNSGGADGATARENQAAYQRIRLRPRVLRPLRDGHTRLTLHGLEYDHPIFIAPTAYHQLAHAEGERATALAAAATRTPMVMSAQSGTRIEDISASAQPPVLWFQLYAQPRREDTLTLARRAQACGAKALMLTVDAQAFVFPAIFPPSTWRDLRPPRCVRHIPAAARCSIPGCWMPLQPGMT